ncbi:MAG: J domain-containing protein [Candidatus Dormibacteraeota bacterium]|nr:J domain-containing protein [Candidatus Dormibacteraeota bacterium]
MPGILSRFGRPRKLTLADKHRLLSHAMDLHRAMTPFANVVEDLQAQGATAEDARVMSADAEARVEQEVLRSVSLPSSAHSDINYYLLLGVTPRATTEQIHRAFRRKAKEVHPDRHSKDFTVDQYHRLMTVVGDANMVLSEATTRRAYDIVWRERSRAIARENRKKGQVRGDWETRYRWEMAEMSEAEESLLSLLSGIKASVEGGGTPTQAIVRAIEQELEPYEGQILEIRNQTHALPAKFSSFGERVRNEMQRKERLVRSLRNLAASLPEANTPTGAHAMSGHVDSALQVLEELRQAQHIFELGAARPFI